MFHLWKRVLLIKYKSHISVMLTFAAFKLLLLCRFSSSSWVSWFLENNVFFSINSCLALLSSGYLFIAATRSAFIKLLLVLSNYTWRFLVASSLSRQSREQWWRSGVRASTRLLLMWPGFDAQLASCVGWVCWFSTLLWEVFGWVLRFFPILNNLHLKDSICVNFNLQWPPLSFR